MRHVKGWGVLVFAAILSSSAAVRADTLRVTETVPFFSGIPSLPGGAGGSAGVSISFDWNTANDKIFNAVASDGFVYANGTQFNSNYNAIDLMDWVRPKTGSYIQQDNEYDSGTNFLIYPKPGTYDIVIYEEIFQPDGFTGMADVLQVDATVAELHGNPHFADPVATPEPTTIVLGGGGLLLLLAESLRRSKGRRDLQKGGPG